MRLEFSNKKERKNCQGLIKALKEVEKHNLKDSEKPVFLTLTAHDLRVSPFLEDPHTSRVEATCEVVIRGESFSRQEEEVGKVFKFKSFKLLRAFRKNENKIVLIELQFGAEGLTVYFETENKQFICESRVECAEVEMRWPQNFESTRESNYEVIPIGKVGEPELSGLSFGEGKDNLWIEIAQQALFFRTVLKGKYRHESRMPIGADAGFVFNNLKAKLKNHTFVNLAGQYLLDHLHEILKKKKSGLLFVKIVWDPYVSTRVRHSYLMSKVATELGFVIKSVECLLCEQMGEEGERGLRQEREQGEEQRGREGSLLKREEGGMEGIRRIVINQTTAVDEDRREARGAYLETRLINKIEENDETITRRFQSRY